MALKDADLDVAISDSGSTKDASWGAVQKMEAVDMDMGKNVSRLLYHWTQIIYSGSRSSAAFVDEESSSLKDRAVGSRHATIAPAMQSTQLTLFCHLVPLSTSYGIKRSTRRSLGHSGEPPFPVSHVRVRAVPDMGTIPPA